MCKPCQQYRKEMGEAMSQGAFIKAAQIAMAGSAAMVKNTVEKIKDSNAKKED